LFENEPGTISLRPVLVVIALLGLASSAFLIYSCSHAPPVGSFSAPINRFPANSVTYLSSGRSYLVRMEDGSFLALSEVDADPANRLKGCVIRYRPDLTGAGKQGAFRDDCSGALFDLEGLAIEGGSPPMQRHPVQVTDRNVSVRFKICISGGPGGGAAEPCRE
jgi:hypothetical protein